VDGVKEEFTMRDFLRIAEEARLRALEPRDFRPFRPTFHPNDLIGDDEIARHCRAMVNAGTAIVSQPITAEDLKR
jgi:hypothetical protein